MTRICSLWSQSDPGIRILIGLAPAIVTGVFFGESAGGLLDNTTESATEALIPTMFNFPNAGKLLSLPCIPFAAWLTGVPMPACDYFRLLAVGIPTCFAKAQIAPPYLLADGVIDIMPETRYRPYWFSSLRLSEPYFTGYIGLAVRDERRQDHSPVIPAVP